MEYKHQPVLLAEVLGFLDPKPGENFVDATLGGGGYSRAILEKNQPDGKVLAIDLDEEAIKNYQLSIINYQNRIILHQGNFRDIDKIVKHHQFANISGIVADLGLSSYELDQSGRGFSFQKKEILDMRFDRSQKLDARFILNNYEQKQLEKIFKDFGEEKFSRQVARQAVELRAKGIEIKYSTDLYQIIKDALPKPFKHRANDSARRIFQAIRIEVNRELDSLRDFLPKAFNLLMPKGRLIVVSFHSLEDRMVKQFFAALTKGCVCPPEFPTCICGKNPQGKLLLKKPAYASLEEQNQNPRAKPAKLRAIIKL